MDTSAVDRHALEELGLLARSSGLDVAGERRLGGGDNVASFEAAVTTGYPCSHSAFAESFSVPFCSAVDGITILDQPFGSELP